MARVTRKQMDALVKDIESDAKELGIMAPYEELIWVPGSTTNGIAPEVNVYIRQETGLNRVSFGTVDFLPKFTYKTTATEAHALLTATLRALAAAVKAR